MSKGTILVVEDEAIEGLEVQEYLKSLGYEVPEIVQSGDRVCDSVLRHKPNLIIMDIRLKSFMDGIDAVRRLEMVCRTPVIYLTAYQNRETMEKAMATNPVAYLLKPFKDWELRESIETALGKN